MGASVVLKMISILPKNQFYNLYFDRFFPSSPLLVRLSELGHFDTSKTKKK